MSLINYHSPPTVEFAFVALKWLLTILLIASSRLWQSGWIAWLMGIGLVVTALGLLFQVEHWTFTAPLLLTGTSLLFLTYAYWFARKPVKTLLSWLKMAWVAGFAAGVLAWRFSPAFIQPFSAVAEALFWALALLYVYQRWVRRPAPESE